MACFIVSGAEAIIVTAVAAAQKRKEKKMAEAHVEVHTDAALPTEEPAKIPLSRKLKWLSAMLWGGVILLALEHIWHGEIVPFPPFLTAMETAEGTAAMLREMATVGVCMAAIITVVWIVMCVVADAVVKRSAKSADQKASA